jgi:hypothetical protein
LIAARKAAKALQQKEELLEASWIE